MIRIWKEGGALERLGVLTYGATLVFCFVDAVDVEALPEALDRLVVTFPMMAIGTTLIIGGQRLRHRAEDRRRRK